MGCTSSAPNMPDIITNTNGTPEHNNVTTGDTDIEMDIKQGTSENDSNDAKITKIDVLPTCDSLEDNIQVARDNNSFTSVINEEREHDDNFSSGIENEKYTAIEELLDENKLSTLKEVADQVILDNVLEEIDNTLTQAQEETQSNSNKDIEEAIENVPELVKESNNGEQEDFAGEEHIEETASPSQSDGNRSTRWEALADIAAELPPSLAVDPITGQIYSLAK